MVPTVTTMFPKAIVKLVILIAFITSQSLFGWLIVLKITLY